MLNPPEFGNGSTASGNGELTRYHFYLDTGSVVATGFPTLLTGDTSRYIKQFDFPTINEAYRGKEVSETRLNPNHHEYCPTDLPCEC